MWLRNDGTGDYLKWLRKTNMHYKFFDFSKMLMLINFLIINIIIN